MADPLLRKQFPEKGLNEAVAIAAMCLQEEAGARPLMSDVVTALSFLSNSKEPIPDPIIPSDEDEYSGSDEDGSEYYNEDNGSHSEGYSSDGHQKNENTYDNDNARSVRESENLESSNCRSRILPPLNCSILAKIFLLGVIGYQFDSFSCFFSLSICQYVKPQKKVWLFSRKLGLLDVVSLKNEQIN